MEFKEPEIIAQNNASGSYVPGCDTTIGFDQSNCAHCEHAA